MHIGARNGDSAGSSRCLRSCSNCLTSWKAALRIPGTKQHLLAQRGDLLTQLRLDAASRTRRAWEIRPVLTDSRGPHRPVPRVTSPQAVLPCPCALAAHALERAEAPQAALPVVARVLSWEGRDLMSMQASQRCNKETLCEKDVLQQTFFCRFFLCPPAS